MGEYLISRFSEGTRVFGGRFLKTWGKSWESFLLISKGALVDVGFDAQVDKTFTVFADYTVQAGQDN